MEPFAEQKGVVAALDRVNVDTDQIIPKQFLKRIERTGFGQFLFFDWKFLADGSLNPDFELNREEFEGATILLAGANFGCGSSREHAPWSLLDYGFRVIIAPSFADIFFNNCFKNGMLPIRLPQAEVDRLFEQVEGTRGYQLSIDLERQTITDGHGLILRFEVESFRRDALLRGLDDIGLTLQQEDKIEAFEARRRAAH